MPDFEIQITGGNQIPWLDAPSVSPAAPSRLVPDPNHPPTYRQIETGTLTFEAVVDGDVAPLDVDLDGRLFTWEWIEWSGTTGPPAIVLTAAQSSTADVTLTSAHAGHFILRALRDGGGAMFIPFDVEDL